MYTVDSARMLCYNNTRKGGATVAISEAKKKANAKWDSENMATIGVRLKKEQAEAFKDFCAKQGKTSNAVLREFILECIDETMERDGE